MTSESKTLPRDTSEILVESDWLTTLGVILGLTLCGLLLTREVRRFVWGRFDAPTHIHFSFFSISTGVVAVIAAVYCFIFAFRLPRISVRIACFLMGLDLAGSTLLSFFRIPPNVWHIVAVSKSFMFQVALVIFAVAIAQWLRSIIKRASPSEPQGGTS